MLNAVVDNLMGLPLTERLPLEKFEFFRRSEVKAGTGEQVKKLLRADILSRIESLRKLSKSRATTLHPNTLDIMKEAQFLSRDELQYLTL